MFLFHLTYVKPLAEIDALLPEHLRYLDGQYQAGRFLCSGRKAPRTGGVILCDAPTREAAEQIAAQDPFFREGAASYEIIEFIPSKASGAFRALL